MIYPSHTLFVQNAAVVIEDECGRPVMAADSTWCEIGPCRCDHTGEKEIRLSDGSISHSDYHIVIGTKSHGVHIGDIVRCAPLPQSNGIECTGKVIRVRNLNFFSYAEIDI